MRYQGAAALAERLSQNDPDTPYDYGDFANLTTGTEYAVAILGTTGLFIADVTKHEPIGSARQEAAGRGSVDCICGHLTPNTESYFDHLSRPSEPVEAFGPTIERGPGG